MIRECAWCHEILGADQSNTEQQVSHTICEPCGARMLAEMPDAHLIAHMHAFASAA
jgi:hypothetical protein